MNAEKGFHQDLTLLQQQHRHEHLRVGRPRLAETYNTKTYPEV